MKSSGKCPKCGSTRISAPAQLRAGGGVQNVLPVTADVDGDPDALLLKDRESSDLIASVCAECGYLEIYAAQPEPLYYAFQKAQGRTNSGEPA